MPDTAGTVHQRGSTSGRHTVELEDLLEALNAGQTITGNSPLHQVMHRTSQGALRITGELNTGYQEPQRVRELPTALTGRPVDDSVTVFPPFYSDFGKNITLGNRIFIQPVKDSVHPVDRLLRDIVFPANCPMRLQQIIR